MKISKDYTLEQLASPNSGIIRALLLLFVVSVNSGCDLVLRVVLEPLDKLSEVMNPDPKPLSAEDRRALLRHMHGPATVPHKHENSGKGDHNYKFMCKNLGQLGSFMTYPSNIDCGTTHMHGPEKQPHQHPHVDKQHGVGYSCSWKSDVFSSDKFCSDHMHDHVHWVAGTKPAANKHSHHHEHVGDHTHTYKCALADGSLYPSDKSCEHTHGHMHGPNSKMHNHMHAHVGKHAHAPEVGSRIECNDVGCCSLEVCLKHRLWQGTYASTHARQKKPTTQPCTQLRRRARSQKSLLLS